MRNIRTQFWILITEIVRILLCNIFHIWFNFILIKDIQLTNMDCEFLTSLKTNSVISKNLVSRDETSKRAEKTEFSSWSDIDNCKMIEGNLLTRSKT